VKLKIKKNYFGGFQSVEVKGAKKKFKITRYLKLQQVAKNIEDVIYIFFHFFFIVKSG
jgi:hypothetical protein